MIRPTGLRSHRGMAAAIVVLTACGGTIDSRQNSTKGSQAPGTSSGGQGDTSSSGAGASGATGGGPGASGSSSSGASSSSSSGPSSSSSSGASSSSSSGSSGSSGGVGSDGGTRSTRGCELGTSCIPGTDLAAPPAADGFQIVTPPGTYTVEPGQEIFPNYCVTVPSTTEFDVGRIQSWMTPGSSHELIVYLGGTASGSQSCMLGADKMIFMASSSTQIVELKMPDGVGYALQPSTQLIVSMKLSNTGTSTIEPQVKLNFFRAAAYRYEAGMMVSFNTNINVPVSSAAGPGIQTVTGSCTGSAGSQFFAIGTHTNQHGTTADVSFESGTTTNTNVVHTTNWAYPDVGVWPATPFLTLQSGDSLAYSCAYANPGSSPITVGETDSNEICMLVGYYFPAGSASCM